MQAIIMNQPGEMHVGEGEKRTPGAGEVAVRVGAAGICAGDMSIYRGKNPYAIYPCIGGHEVSGVVESVGEGMRGWREGDRVVVEPFLGCGKCYACRVGKSNCCANLTIIGVHLPGGYAESVIAPATHLHKIPDGLSLARASLTEPVAIAVQACRRAEVSAGELVFVLGCGPIGLALIEVAKAHGAAVVATDVSPVRLEIAASLGAETHLADDSLNEWAITRTNGEGPSVVIEATGVPAVMRQAAELVAAGGRVTLVGLIPRGVDVAFPGLDFTRKEMTLLGSRASVGCFPEALELLASGKITYAKAATEISLWDAPQIFAQLNENPTMLHKGILIP